MKAKPSEAVRNKHLKNKNSLIDTFSNSKISTVLHLRPTDTFLNFHGNLPRNNSIILH